MRVRSFAFSVPVSLAALGVAVSALASPCDKPPKPACMGDGTTYVAVEKLLACQDAVREYIDRTTEYNRCLGDEINRTGAEMTRSVDLFNCRLAARQDCR